MKKISFYLNLVLDIFFKQKGTIKIPKKRKKFKIG